MSEDPGILFIPPSIAGRWEEYQVAKASKRRWEEREKDLKTQIMAHLGYDPEDPKPAPVTAVSSETGVPIFDVKVSFRRGLNTRYLKEHHPDIYAECEQVTPVKTLKESDVPQERD